MKDLNIAIVGAGLGGMTAAASLQSFGFKVEVYEQAAKLGEIGAGISLPPNSTRILEHLGLGEALASFEGGGEFVPCLVHVLLGRLDCLLVDNGLSDFILGFLECL